VSPQESKRPFAQVLEDYARLEPGEGDTWNPLLCDVELEHRAELLKQLTFALRAADADPQALRVLDVGCGNGRSTRMYLDLGLGPTQITGVDLRAGALERARALHPGIAYRLHDGGPLPFEDGSMDWISLCTVLSSVRAGAERRALGGEITRVLRPGGHLFFWDLLRANDFAGGDPLRPQEIFPDLHPLASRPATIRGFGARESQAGAVARLWHKMRDSWFARPTHAGVLLRR
jgi:SAM-dependent methyltransferase